MTTSPTYWRDLARALLGDLGGLTPPAWIPLAPPSPLASGARIGLLVVYYTIVLGGLVALYAVKPATPPPFIYQGF